MVNCCRDCDHGVHGLTIACDPCDCPCHGERRWREMGPEQQRTWERHHVPSLTWLHWLVGGGLLALALMLLLSEYDVGVAIGRWMAGKL